MSAAAALAQPMSMDASVLTNGSDSAPNSAVKERHSLSLDQRRALRRWANSQSTRPSHKACIEWFLAQYGQAISQSTVSHSLSPKYARLDGDPQLSGSRLRFGNWPDVEKLVLMWHTSMVNSGRQPTNEELAEKAKVIFQQLPRYKDDPAPEFSPGWIHRFKKRYGLLIRRQRRHGTMPPAEDDIPYLVDTVPRFMNVTTDTSPAAIREAVHRIVGVEPSLATCARVRDEVVRRLENPHLNHNGQPNHPVAARGGSVMGVGASGSQQDAEGEVYGENDPETLLQNALQALQQEEADVEAQAAAEREAREREDRGLPPLDQAVQQQQQQQGQSYAQQAAGAALATPVRNGGAANGGPRSVSQQRQQQQNGQHNQARFTPSGGAGSDLNLTPIPANGPTSSTDEPMRCPFCINQRMLRTIKEAVEHMATHVVV